MWQKLDITMLTLWGWNGANGEFGAFCGGIRPVFVGNQDLVDVAKIGHFHVDLHHIEAVAEVEHDLQQAG